MLNLHFSNRSEVLEAELLRRLAASGAGVFDVHQVIVASAAMQRRLTLAIADREGICANVRFSFLAQWLWAQIAERVPAVAEQSPFAPAVLGWRVFGIFGDADFLCEQPRLGDYLQQADEAMRHELALRSAALLEQYITYRPDWLAAWSEGRPTGLQSPDERWQAALWRRVAAELGSERQHPALSFLRSVEASRAAGADTDLPREAHVYALPSIPPLYLALLQRLARSIELHLYVLDPCREYWFEVVDPRRLGRLAVAGDTGYHEVGNRLLASWGRQTQAQLELLHAESGEAKTDERYLANPAHTLLARVQNAVLDLVELPPASIALAADDRSIEVHVCHSLLRQLEVLHDRLLGLFAGADPPQPADIVVVTPDLDTAAPLIDAVFATQPADRTIAYRISGRPRSTQNAAAQALLTLLALAGSRWRASAVVDLLQQPLVGRRFGFADEAALAALGRWLRAAGIRWGFDAGHRERLGLPATARHGFDDGLQRLFLGYAMPDSAAAPFNARLPAGSAEGSAAEALGGFWRFVDALARLQRAIAAPLAADGWSALLAATIDDFLLPASTQDEDDLAELRASLQALHAEIAEAGFDGVIAADVWRGALGRRLDDPARGGVPTGAVTFSSIASLRNLPFRVVCAIGLDDGVFPSPSRAPEFDLMTSNPRRGDRQRRIDDRNLFLDLVLAARETLHLSYTGRSARDNAPLPPSVLVAELLDALVPAIAADAGCAESLREARRRLVVDHPLQPFTAASFDAASDFRLRSHDIETLDALGRQPRAAAVDLALAGDDDNNDDDDAPFEAPFDAAAFFAAPLAEPDAAWREVTIERLTSFFRDPCGYLLERRLGIALPAREDELLDDEPLLADFGGRAALADRLLRHCLAGVDASALRDLAIAGTEFPGGRLGELLLDRELRSLRRFAERVGRATATPPLPPASAVLDFDLDGAAWRLCGDLAGLRPEGLVRSRCDDARPVDYLAGWIAHLWLCANRPQGVALQTTWHSRDRAWRLRPVEGARSLLQELLSLYRRGLMLPLRFYPKSAWRYIAGERNLAKARDAWVCTRERPFGEAGKPAHRLALRGVADPLDGEFVRCAETVFGTLRDHLEEDVR